MPPEHGRPTGRSRHHARLRLRQADPEERQTNEDAGPARGAPHQVVDVDAVVEAAAEAIDAFLEERRAAGLPLPERESIEARLRHLAANVDPRRLTGTNSVEENRYFVLVHRDEPPYFSVATSKTVPGG